MRYGYARVSGKSQDTEGNSLEAQKNALMAQGCVEVVPEVFTGKTTDRPKLNALVAKMQEGDVLVVTKLDRFARSTKEGIAMIEELTARGIAVHVLNMGLIDNTPIGELMVQVMLAISEFERKVIAERTKEGKAIARAQGKRVDGRKPIEIPDFKKYFQKKKDGIMTVKEICAELGISRTTWYELERRAA
jgi:DNA invertase Pin-like site-specific DNA recombinase